MATVENRNLAENQEDFLFKLEMWEQVVQVNTSCSKSVVILPDTLVTNTDS